MDSFYSLNDRNPIRHGSNNQGRSSEYGPGGGRYERAVGTTAQIQSPDVVRATSQINSPLYPLDDVKATSPMPVAENVTEKNEIPLNHPRQDESRLLKHLLTNYDKRVRPILDAKKNITIYVGITLTQIFDMVSISKYNIHWIFGKFQVILIINHHLIYKSEYFTNLEI